MESWLPTLILAAIESWHAAITVVASLLSAGFALVCREGLAAWLKWKADKRIDTQYEDAKIKTGYETLAAKDQARISTLEQLLLKSQADHLDCTKVQAGLQVQVNYQEKEITRQNSELLRQQKEIDTLRSRLDRYNFLDQKPPDPETLE